MDTKTTAARTVRLASLGGAPRAHRLAVCCALLASLPIASLAAERPAPPPVPPPAPRGRVVVPDSIAKELRLYARALSQLQDSTTAGDVDLDSLYRRRQEMIDLTIEEFGGVLSELRDELSRFNLQIDDNVISLSNGEGGEVAITVPEDLGDRISEGITSITRRILDDLPDTLRIGGSASSWDFTPPGVRAAPRRVIDGDLIRFRDDVIIHADEEVRGDVIVLFADAVVSGRVDGKVVVVFGDLLADDTAEITESATVVGRFDRGDDAHVGSVTVIDPMLRGGELFSGRALFDTGWIGFAVVQGLFLVSAVVALVILLIGPRTRLHTVVSGLQQHPGSALGFGFLGMVFGHGTLVVITVVLVITVIGIPLAVLLLLTLGLLGITALTIVSLVIGRGFCALLKLPCAHDWATGLAGLLVLHAPNFFASLIGAVSGGESSLAAVFAVLGCAVLFFAYLFGLGALLQTRFGLRSPDAAERLPAESVPAA